MTFPTDLSQLTEFLEDSRVDSEVLSRFSILPAETVKNVGMGGQWIVTQAQPVDKEFDNRVVIGPNGYGSTSWRQIQDGDEIAANGKWLEPVYKAFVARYGQGPVDPSQLEPYLQTPEQRATYEKLVERMRKLKK